RGELGGVVDRARRVFAAGVDQLPRRARIVGAEEPAVLVLDERVDAVRVRPRNADGDLADEALRHAGVARDLAPRLAAVDRFEEAAARSAARHLIFDAIRLPQRGEHHAWIPPIDLDVHGAGLVVPQQLALPP